MERYCRNCELRSSRVKLLVTFHDHRFVGLVHRDITCTEAIQTLNSLVKELFPAENREIEALTLSGYTLPGKYLIGDLCEHGAQVEAQSAEIEVKKPKRPAVVPQTEPVKKSKRTEEVTPAGKVKFSSLFHASEMKAEDKPSDPSDSDDSVFQVDTGKKPRVNVFRK